ncbi:hypothetical protein U9M48_005459 [Paspalum notatum var. saurae]|uniref:Uncharacterized protein n=1 Tax=Paspalum notatum var. saurae TaxID=547442 RepID=A0AAQ3PSB4_PASNO
MALAKFTGYAEVLSNFNACREFFSWTTSGIIKAIHYQQNTPQLPDKANTTAQHQIKDDIEQLMDGIWKLKTTMPKMLNLIDQVEWQSHKEHAAGLLPDIKDAVYDAEDLLDEFDYYVLKLKIESSKNSGQDNLSDTFLEFFNSFRSDGYIRKVNRIQAKLDHVHHQSMDMHLDQEPQKFDKSVRPETCAFIDEPKIFGREEELKYLVKTLVPARKRSRADSKSTMVKLHVLPIVGMGGVGKTTIAQQICNDANVKRHFGENIIWTCVSDDFDIKRLTKEILQHSGEGTSSDSLNILLKKLEGFVKFKRFLIVLDDMWDDILKQDGAGWRKLFKCLENCAEGSRILVTTRSSEVATLVGTMDHYKLDGLKDGVFWDFFKLCAFEPTSSCNNQESLESIGKSILPKLKGSPLAAKTIGRLLRMNLSTTHWKNIAESELWQLEQKETTDILPALRLSYMYLPQQLKRCFSICAIYLKDHKFDKDILAAIWIAQGYVMDPEEASVCIEALANRSFVQKQSPDDSYYVIHDLMHDMAQLVSKDECFIIKHASDLDKVPSNVCHLSMFPNRMVGCPELKSICSKKKLRSLVFVEYYGWAQDCAPVFECWFKELLRLRVLRLVCEVSQVPESMGHSKHLRYFSLCKRDGSPGISNVTFPTSISRLHHLKIIDCGSSVIGRFPPGFSDLVNLRKIKSRDFNYDRDQSHTLSLRWSPARTSHDEAELMFNQMEAIPHWNLQHLKVHSYGGESFPSWLRPHLLPRLRSLEFYYCGKIKSIPFFDNSAGAGLDNHNIIEELAIRYCYQINWKRLVEVPTSVRKLIICKSGYFMDNLVSRFRNLTSLTYLQIDDCEWLTVIPLDVWSSNLPSLEELHISRCRHLTSIGVSGANSRSNSSYGVKGFSSLSKIHIRSCYELLSLEEFLAPDYLPAVKSICVESCYLTSLSVDRLDGLQKLSILGCLRLRVMTFPSTLKELLLSTCRSIESININNSQLGSSPALQKLTISSCPVLRSIGGATAVAKIKEVEISDCPELEEIRQPLRHWYVQWQGFQLLYAQLAFVL